MLKTGCWVAEAMGGYCSFASQPLSTQEQLDFFKYILTNQVFFTCIGKILQDDKTVEFYNIQEKDFLVCLPAKVRKRNTGFPPLSKFPWNDLVQNISPLSY
jgi:hypothetical protein